MKKLIYILLKRYPRLDVNALCFSCLFIFPGMMFAKLLVYGFDDLSYFLGIGYLLSFCTNRFLWNLRGKLFMIKTQITIDNLEEKTKQETPRQKPNLYIVRK